MIVQQAKKLNQHENLCEELLRERAAVFSRAGFAVEDALERLMQIDRVIEMKIALMQSCNVSGQDQQILNQKQSLFEEINLSVEQFNAVCEKAHLQYYYLIVTREALGLRRHEMVQELYRIPEKKKKMQAI